MADLTEIMDTTLRDGEQTQGVSFNAREKLSIAKMLLEELKVDRIEVASARVSEGEQEAVKEICAWAKKAGFLGRIEVLSFVDLDKSPRWVSEAGCRTMNLLVKGSLKHCEKQLGKTREQHFEDVKQTVENAKSLGLAVNAYLEDWSNGMQEAQDYVFALTRMLLEAGAKRIMLADTLGVLSPKQTTDFVSACVEKFPKAHFDFHAHNDYGLATANSLAAAEAGCKGVHVTMNSLGERAGNASLAEVVVALHDKTHFKTNVSEKGIFRASRLVEALSGKRISENKPIVGENVFTQTAGVHADGDLKARLYQTSLNAERFGRKTEYALGKLSGKASLELNLQRLGLELSAEQKKSVLQRIVELGDKKEKVTQEDLPFIVADVLDTPENKRLSIEDLVCVSGKNVSPKASFTLRFNGTKIEESSSGDGGYDAFMKALSKACKKIGLELPQLVDYEVRIPPGGKTDALVETTISWQKNSSVFRTIGVDTDQLMAAIKATEKMLNLVASKATKK